MALEQRNKIVALQTDLTNSEEVQRDFVRLSQSLQQELERIRESGTLVIHLCKLQLLTFNKLIIFVCRFVGSMKKISMTVVIVALCFQIQKFEKYLFIIFVISLSCIILLLNMKL